MKLIALLTIVLLIAQYNFLSTDSLKPGKPKTEKKLPVNSLMRAFNLKNIRKVKNHVPPKPTEIAYEEAARLQSTLTNSIGETGVLPTDKINLNNFPFVLSRCDQVVHFPVEYINNEDDYRVRHRGFVTITAHFTNLFNEHDAQKLIQSTTHSRMVSSPCHLKGARGCIRVPKDSHYRLHNIDICVDSMTNAKNLLFVYRDFNRCRIGDSLLPIPVQLINSMEELCKKKNKHFSTNYLFINKFRS